MTVATYAGPSLFEKFLYLHVVIVCFFWPAAVYLLYRTLPWTFGREAAAAWPGRRRIKLLATALGVGVAPCLAMFIADGHGRFIDGFFTINPRQFANWYADPPNASFFTSLTIVMAVFEMSITLSVLMFVKIYECAASGRASEAELSTGWRGVRAWLGWPKLLWAAGVVLCVTAFAASVNRRDPDGAAMAFGLSILATLVVLLATPVLRTLRAAGDRETAVNSSDGFRAGADLSPERQRVMRLLEDGRVTADEAAELLTALAATASPGAPAGPLPVWRKLVLAGAAMVLVGFFLPWFRINPYAEIQRAMGTAFGRPNAALTLSRTMPGQTLNLSHDLSRMTLNGVETPWPPFGEPLERAMVTIAGGDVGRGFGWVVLATALAAAAVPVLATGLSRPGQRQAMWLAAAAGAVVVLYLLTSGLSAASYGLVLATLGMATIVAGLVAELPRRDVRPAAMAAAVL